MHFAMRRSGGSRLMSNPFSFAFRGGITLLRIYRDYEPLIFFGAAGCFMIMIGFVVFLYTFLVAHQIADITVISLTVAGVQVVLFGFLADMMGRRNAKL